MSRAPTTKTAADQLDEILLIISQPHDLITMDDLEYMGILRQVADLTISTPKDFESLLTLLPSATTYHPALFKSLVAKITPETISKIGITNFAEQRADVIKSLSRCSGSLPVEEKGERAKYFMELKNFFEETTNFAARDSAAGSDPVSTTISPTKITTISLTEVTPVKKDCCCTIS